MSTPVPAGTTPATTGTVGSARRRRPGSSPANRGVDNHVEHLVVPFSGRIRLSSVQRNVISVGAGFL